MLIVLLIVGVANLAVAGAALRHAVLTERRVQLALKHPIRSAGPVK